MESVSYQPALINASAFLSLLNSLPHASFSTYWHWYGLASHILRAPRWFVSTVADWDDAHITRLFDLSVSDWIRSYTPYSPMPGC